MGSIIILYLVIVLSARVDFIAFGYIQRQFFMNRALAHSYKLGC